MARKIHSQEFKDAAVERANVQRHTVSSVARPAGRCFGTLGTSADAAGFRADRSLNNLSHPPVLVDQETLRVDQEPCRVDRAWLSVDAARRRMDRARLSVDQIPRLHNACGPENRRGVVQTACGWARLRVNAACAASSR